MSGEIANCPKPSVLFISNFDAKGIFNTHHQLDAIKPHTKLQYLLPAAESMAR